jgi:glyoxylate/hydroxypyruvate reductase
VSVLLLCRAEPLERWHDAIVQALPSERVYTRAQDTNAAQIEVVIADAPPRESLGRFANLRLIQSLWMGVDGWLNDATVPTSVPLARMLDPSMVTAMIESATAHVLHAHLHHDDMRRQQSERTWREFFNPLARERRVGILGMGNLGAAVARALTRLGFRVNAWSRAQKPIDGVRWFGTLDEFLSASEIVVCLLPLTGATRGIANAKFFAAMRADSVFINLGRGAHVIEDDLLAALDRGKPRHAILDVFANEPLPSEHAFWSHPRITVTPHSASMANPVTAAAFVAENVRRLRAGEALLGAVDRDAGY